MPNACSGMRSRDPEDMPKRVPGESSVQPWRGISCFTGVYKMFRGFGGRRDIDHVMACESRGTVTADEVYWNELWFGAK